MEKNKLKKFLKTTKLSLLYCIIGLLIWAFISLFTIRDIQVTITVCKYVILAIGGLIVFLDFCGLLYYGIIVLTNKNEIIKNENYERDIPKDVPPAIASMLLDYIIDNERDYTATVASLIAKGYLTVNNNVALRVFRWDKENLLEHERVVFEALTKEEIYNEEKFKNAVRNDALNLGFVQRKVKNYAYLIPVVFLIAVIWILRPDAMETFNPLLYIIFTIALCLLTVFTIVMTVFSSNKQSNTEKGNFTRTELGIEKSIKLTGLKKFLHDYTLLKEKGLADTILYDEYIAYAIALGEADAIENLILNNDKYRSLVYRKTQESTDPIQKNY